jgi:quercetin dioxygenase-like cupin family protein
MQSAVSKAATQEKQASSKDVYQHELPNVTMDGWEVNVSEVTFPPGYSGKAHHHPGFVLVYVMEGALESKVSGLPKKIYQAGEMFFEEPGSTHEVSHNMSESRSAKILAMIFSKKGLPLTTTA